MTTLACAANVRNAALVAHLPWTLPAPTAPQTTPSSSLTTLQHQLPTATIFVLVGADSFLDPESLVFIPDRLLNLAEWIVVSRPGFRLQNPADPSHH